MQIQLSGRTVTAHVIQGTVAQIKRQNKIDPTPESRSLRPNKNEAINSPEENRIEIIFESVNGDRKSALLEVLAKLYMPYRRPSKSRMDIEARIRLRKLCLFIQQHNISPDLERG